MSNFEMKCMLLRRILNANLIKSVAKLKSKTKTKTHIMSVTRKKCICYWKNILMESLVLRVNLFFMYVYMLQFAHFLLLHFFLCSKAIGMNVMSCVCSYACPLYAFALIAERAHTHTDTHMWKKYKTKRKKCRFSLLLHKSQ